MHFQHKGGISEIDLISLCRKLAGRNRNLVATSNNKSTLTYALSRSLIKHSKSGYALTSQGKVWLKQKLSDGSHEIPRIHDRPEAFGTSAEGPLAWLRRRKDKSGEAYISKSQFEAGERLREDFTYAQLWGTVKSNWRSEQSVQSTSKIDGVTDSVYDARQRLQNALSAVGPELSGTLLDVCCFLKSLKEVEGERQWPQRTAKIVLGLGLDRLADHYVSPRSYAVGPANSEITSWQAETSKTAPQTHRS
ncbi:hypothetical protein PsAD2_00951 [Pseudovibrio axinellae]|uniref:DUF6456 domain-containing protein n=1 Tax=Pseudovibrio axinellae TaxID=989403 RepID=A0A161VAC8_9HYPH|nr:DUF6456 domain-containing protein [Pseudovibrio axinellae]KZL20959.1 hypothetical protein PsAD2_00951 [Pseudovibrio axinellae]SEP81298.1 hypothetical protein SAMN05421798_101450 [Pseudovibrio axinellae]